MQGRIEVYLDGGIRTGSDVLKALALGAKCVFIGRPAVWGLAYKVEQQQSYKCVCERSLFLLTNKKCINVPVRIDCLLYIYFGTIFRYVLFCNVIALPGRGRSERSTADLERRVPSLHGLIR